MEMIIFNDDMTWKSVFSLVNDILESKEPEIIIYFSSRGGELKAMWYLNDVLARVSKTKKIEFVAQRYIDSAALEFILTLPPGIKLSIIRGTTGFAHLLSRDVSWRELQNPSEQEKMFQEWFEKDIAYHIETAEQYGLTQEEITRLKKYEDIYLSPDRMEELISHRNKKQANEEQKFNCPQLPPIDPKIPMPKVRPPKKEK